MLPADFQAPRRRYMAEISKADPGPASRTRAPLFEKKFGGCFLNVDYIIRTYYEFSQHTMLTISILFTTLTT